MRGTYAAVLALLVGAAACAGPPADPIRLPDGPVVPAPMPPAPAPAPGGVVTLSPDLLYVFDADVDCLVLASPAGLVAVTPEAGPVRVRGKFADDPGRTQTRTFKGKTVFTVEPLKAGRVELLVVPAGAAAEKDVLRRTLDVQAGEGPRPPPAPEPKPKPPEPAPPDAPIPVPGLRVLMVFETADAAKLTPGQQQAIYGKATRDLLNEKCVAGPDGKTKEWRIFDKDVDAAADNKLWADALRRPRTALPWLVVSNGVGGFEGPLVDAAQVADLVAKFGGK